MSQSTSLRGLLVAQFFGVFNDNAWKLIVIFLGMRAAGSAAESSTAKQFETTLAFIALTLPLILFSLPAGMLADRVSKRTIMIAMKGLELVLMLAGTMILFFLPTENQPLLVAVLALMGMQSAIFSPAKYGILPELLPHERLSAGNGVLEMWSFLAVILGTAAGPLLVDGASEIGAGDGSLWLAGLVLSALAFVGVIASRQIPVVPVACSQGSPTAPIRSAWRAIRDERVLWLTVLGSTCFWTIVTLAGQNVLVYTEEVLESGQGVMVGLPYAAFGVGVGVGSFLAGRISGNKVESGLIPLGAAGLALGLLLFGIIEPGFAMTLVLMLAMGLTSGLLVVPLNALLQWRAPKTSCGAVIAVAHVFKFGGMLVGTLTALVLAHAGFPVTQSMIVAAFLTIGGTVWALWILPDAFLRLVLILLTHSLYRLKVIGRRNVPVEGGALLVPNHVSFADGLFLLASVDRPIRFIVDAAYFHHPLLKPFMKSLGAIPITASGGPRVVLRALRDAGKHLDDRHLVCIFAEGQITRTGMMLPFRRGLERIVKGRDVPVVPVHLDGVWGSIFSHSGGRFITKLPQRVPYPVTVTFGEPLPAGTPVYSVRRAVNELAEVAWSARTPGRRPLHRTFISRVRRHPFRLMYVDDGTPRMTRFRALVGVIALARSLRDHWEGQKNVGILLPSTVAGALANLAATFSGRTSVNLNFTSGAANIASAVLQAGLTTVLTSRAFMGKMKIELPEDVKVLWIEDIASSIRLPEKVAAFVLAVCAPKRLLEIACGADERITVNDTVTIIFSSGSTGDPKGVMLSHANIVANVDGIAQVTRVNEEDRLLGILPLFHSFGYTALWFGSNRDLATIFYPNPLDAGTVGELVHRYNVSVLIATPTFLQLYLRRCTPAQFGSLRLVMVGAEKLSTRLATAFEDQFGIRPLEGYGTTECSPAITVSALDYRAPGFFQPGSRRGSVGQPLPGVAVRIVDPDSHEILPAGESGLIMVKGPNVMQGYLGQADLTAEVLRDGWYVTGDIGVMDEDGFLKITDRLSRFSKIGGEMVPHGRVEAALQDAAEEDTQVFAVTAVPDQKKGERLAVLHTLDETRLPELVEKVGDMGLPNLFIPRVDQFLKVEAIPVLGTGKVDLKAVKQVAMEVFAPSAVSGAD